jgi:hypothetical protein
MSEGILGNDEIDEVEKLTVDCLVESTIVAIARALKNSRAGCSTSCRNSDASARRRRPPCARGQIRSPGRLVDRQR